MTLNIFRQPEFSLFSKIDCVSELENRKNSRTKLQAIKDFGFLSQVNTPTLCPHWQ